LQLTATNEQVHVQESNGEHRMVKRSIAWAAVLVSVIAVPASAQSWETPTFFSPRPHDDIGVYLIKPEFGDWGVVGIWRQSAGINLGVRGGVGGGSGDRTVLVGAELFGPLNLNTDPVVMYWQSGIGASFDGATALRIPLGVSAGMRLGSEGALLITPYVHPRVAFDLVTFEVGDEEETDSEVNLDVDIGADLELTRSIILRLGYTVTGGDVFGFGAGFRFGRGVAVR
jgi:hypothetical protein